MKPSRRSGSPFETPLQRELGRLPPDSKEQLRMALGMKGASDKELVARLKTEEGWARFQQFVNHSTNWTVKLHGEPVETGWGPAALRMAQLLERASLTPLPKGSQGFPHG